MKKLFTLLAAVTLSAMLFAQAPQSFSYQTVIRDANWQPISNQSVSIKIEIIEDAVNGFVVHEESHSATTNDIGLVNLAIGSVITQGSQFQNINWGQHIHFIRVSVDVSGGLNYIVMGTTQLRSVPYALYAETSGSMLPGPQGIAGNDGVDGTNGNDGVDGVNGAPGVDGINGIDGLPGADGQDGAPGQDGSVGATGSQGIQGVPGNDGQDGNDGAQGIDGADGNDGAPGTNGTNGDDGYTPMFGVDYFNGADGINGNDGTNGVDGTDGLPGADGTNGVDGNDGIDGINGVDGIDGIDAVVDYDSLANLISVDSSFTANVSGGIGGDGCDFLFPEGIEGDIITSSIPSGTTYTVPVGKKLYLWYWRNGDPVISTINTYLGYSSNNSKAIILNSGESLGTSQTNPGDISYFQAMLINDNANVQAITTSIPSGTTYTVPSGKKLYILYWRNGDPIISAINEFFGFSSNNDKALILNSGESLGTTQTNPGDVSYFNGYLVDENYFANCGGGGSSSASSLDSTAIANMIAAAGGGGSFGDFISINTNIETQAISDGFLYGKFHLTNVSTIDIFCDTFSGNTSSRGYFSSNPYGGNYLRDGSFNIPIKKNEYYSFNNTGNSSIYDAYFIPLESGGSSNNGTGNMVVSTFGDTLTMNGQSIIVPGISFSNVVPTFGSVTDIDGNTYQTVSYGDVEWMTENLRTTTFSDGTPISQICQCDNGGSCFCSQPGWCNYNQDISYNTQYGKLYTGYTIASNSNVCPTGWHVSDSNDWDMITDLFVTNGVGTDGYGSTSSGSVSSLLLSQTNESYLSLQLGGYNNGCGGGANMGDDGTYWTTDPSVTNGNAAANINDNNSPYYIYIGYASIYHYKSIRCVKD